MLTRKFNFTGIHTKYLIVTIICRYYIFGRVKDFFELTRIVISWRAGHTSWRIENAVDGETSSNKTSCLSLTSCLGNPCVPPFMIVLYFASFCDLQKIAKLSTRENFYQHIRHVYTKSETGFPFWNMHNHSLWSFLPFLFFLPVPSRARESDVSWWYRWSWESCCYRITGDRAHCTVWHISCKSTRRLRVFTLRQLQPGHFTFGCAKSQNLAWLRELAKINTRKIVGIPKSQNFVLANNSNKGTLSIADLFLNPDPKITASLVLWNWCTSSQAHACKILFEVCYRLVIAEFRSLLSKFSVESSVYMWRSQH